MQHSVDIEFRNVKKSFGNKEVLKGLSFEMEAGHLTSLIGESGCGKTTTLQLINGLLEPDSGEVLIGGRPFDYSHAIKWRRRIGYCLQGYTLFPHMDIFENISLVARREGWSRSKCMARAEELLELLSLSPQQYLRKRPRQLSGGQQQRVGIARALFMHPEVMLMDEPFGALDPITRMELQDAFLDLIKTLNLTVVLVTHDLSEAFKMSHNIILLNEGRIAQIGSPNKLLNQPANQYVRDFLKTTSPAHVLENIKIYSVMKTDILLTKKITDDQYSVERMFSDEAELRIDKKKLLDLHRQARQYAILYVEEDNRFRSYAELDSLEQERFESIQDKGHFAEALEKLLEAEVRSIPVLNKDHQVIGLFGKESFDGMA